MTNNYDYREIDELLHSRIRLSIVSVLAQCKEAEFTWVREKVDTTDGNLTSHARKLEEGGYIHVDKRFVNRKPVTLYRLSDKGREALLEYAKKLANLVAGFDSHQ